MGLSFFDARVLENIPLRGGYFCLALEPCEATQALANAGPGQFIMLRGDWGRELLNPRAFSLLWVQPSGRFAVLLKVYGRGTARLRAARSGDILQVTGPLGRGFPQPPGEEGAPHQVLVAGGVGLPPLHWQARVAAEQGHAQRVEMIYGGRDRDDLVLTEELDTWGIRTTFATEDGSVGVHGRVTDALDRRLQQAVVSGEAVEVLACGPTPMLAAVRRLALPLGVRTLLCLEEEMACGFGVCLGCAIPVHGPKPYSYCCVDGPVFDAREVRWR